MEIGQSLARALGQRIDEGKNAISFKANTDITPKKSVEYAAEKAKVEALTSAIALMKLSENSKLTNMGEDFVVKAEGELSEEEINGGAASLKNIIDEVNKMDEEGLDSLSRLKNAGDTAVLNAELQIGTYEDWETEFEKYLYGNEA